MLKEIKVVVTCITIPIYLILLAVLIKQRRSHFQSAFYIFYISTGFSDIFSCFVRIGFDYIPTYIVDRTLYIDSPLPFATMSLTLYYYIQYVQILGIITISANRLTAIASPFKHQSVWSRRNIICILLVQWTLPLLWIAPTLDPCCRCEFMNGSILPYFTNDVVQDLWYLADGVAGAMIAPITIIVTNALIMFYMRKRNRAMKNVENSDQKMKNEIRLAVVGCALSGTYTTAVCGQIMLYLMLFGVIPYSENFIEFSYEWYLNVFDIFTISNPYFLLFLSSAARKQFFAFFGFKETIPNRQLVTTTHHR